ECRYRIAADRVRAGAFVKDGAELPRPDEPRLQTEVERPAVVIEEGIANPLGNARRSVEIADLAEAVLNTDGRGVGEAQNARRQQLGGQVSSEGPRARIVELEVDPSRRCLGEVEARVGDERDAPIGVEGDR